VPALHYGEVGPAYQRLRRVHYHDDEPYCLIDLYLDKAIYDTDPKAFSSKPVIPQLVRFQGVRIAGAKQVMRIMVSSEVTAQHLGIGVGDPIAHVSRSIVGERNRIIYYAQMFQIEIDLKK
jgi:GntR family transcriptional regulator